MHSHRSAPLSTGLLADAAVAVQAVVGASVIVALGTLSLALWAFPAIAAQEVDLAKLKPAQAKQALGDIYGPTTKARLSELTQEQLRCWGAYQAASEVAGPKAAPALAEQAKLAETVARVAKTADGLKGSWRSWRDKEIGTRPKAYAEGARTRNPNFVKLLNACKVGVEPAQRLVKALIDAR